MAESKRHPSRDRDMLSAPCLLDLLVIESEVADRAAVFGKLR